MMYEKYQTGIDVVAERILDYFGTNLQRIKAVEELCECAARLAKDEIENHIAQNSGTYDMTVEEIADATIMIRQMRIYYGFDSVDQAIERKLNRTIKRMEEKL